MTTRFYRSKEFEVLQREWEKKLKDSGFEDAEEDVGGNRSLKQPANYAYRHKKTTEITRENKLAYYMLLSQHLEQETSFSDESDYLIMKLTARGRSIMEISKELRKRGLKKFNRDTIRYIRRRYENKWGIRTWKPAEMVSRRVRTR